MAEMEAQVETSGPAILIVIAGQFEVEAHGSSECVQRAEAIFCADPGVISFMGSGRAYIAAT